MIWRESFGLLGDVGRVEGFLNSGDILIDSKYYCEADTVLTEQSCFDFVHSDIFLLITFRGRRFLNITNTHWKEGCPIFIKP